MVTVNEIIAESLEGFNESVKEDLANKNMDTTGVAKQSLRVVQNGNILASVGIDYIQYLDRGRPPGKFPPMDVIARWVDVKGLRISPYVVARNIAHNGTRIYRNRELGLKLEDKTAKLNETLNEVLPKFVSNQITAAFNKALKGK